MCEIDLFCRREPTLPADESSDVSIEDLDILFAAVTARLRSLARPRSGSAGVEATRIRASVLDCVQALEQLHVTAMHEVSRLHRFELAAANTPVATP
jgi:hypothetical protein